MLNWLWVFLGGGLGSLARYGLSGLVDRRFETFPWGTLLVNLTGSFAIGLFATLTGPEGRWLAPSSVRIFFMIGVCAGLVTLEKVKVIDYRAVEPADGPGT